jgi:tetratricopeptide repeat protein
MRTKTFLVTLLLALPMLAAQPPAEARKWSEDIAFVKRQIEAKHPNPWRRISKADFEASIDKLQHDVPMLTSEQTAIRLMHIVASLRDGHTSLVPAERSGYDQWFPVRFYELSDGLFINAIDKSQATMAGAKVTRIGSKSAAEAVRLVKEIYSSDNDFAAMEAPSLLSSPRILVALGILDNPDKLIFDAQSSDGATTTIELSAVKGRPRFDWIHGGEMTGPVSGLITPFGERKFFTLDGNPDLPLHLRFRGAYWFSWMEKPRLLYMQLNAMADKSSYTPETFSAFLERVFTFADLHVVDKFVLDLRYNGGGNGRLINAIVHEFIKRDRSIGRSGHLFVIGGRQTYSAGVGLFLAMREHTAAIVAGEPVGAAINGSGDPDVATLPNSGFQLALSTNFSASGNSRDASWLIPVQLPAPFSSADYFGGKDPALDLILSADGVSILERLTTDGGEAAKALYERSKARFGVYPWWDPFDRIQMNEAGFRLLEKGRTADALAAMEMNVDRYPGSWETWDSLAEVLMGMKRNREAIAAYEKALQISPDNWNNAAARKAIEKMKQ